MLYRKLQTDTLRLGGGTGSDDEACRNGMRKAACNTGIPHRIDGEESLACRPVSLPRTVRQISKAWNIC